MREGRVSSLYVASTEAGGGKTTLAVGLCLALREKGIQAGYFKPVGIAGGSGGVEADVAFAADVLGLQESPADLCPVLLREDTLSAIPECSQAEPLDDVSKAWERCAAGHDMLVCEGLGQLWQGRFLRLSGPDVVARLGLRAVIVAKFAGPRQLDDICYAHDVLRKRLAGVVFNMVPETRLDIVRQEYSPFLAQNGITSHGILPADPSLLAVPVRDIATALGGTFVTGEDQAGALADSYLIGAMSAEHALGYFERVPNKVVVVGGDREDLIVAALQTPTSALVLTGSYVPSGEVVQRARVAGVPLISVSGDTVSAADALRRLFGHVRVHERSKIDRIAELVRQHVDTDALLAQLP
jgi:BioD-like phosphotransacetylase family protein